MAFDEPAFTFGDARLMYDDEYQPEEGPVRYRIQENRILKNGDIRYFDHPKFGVIAKVTRIERVEPEESTDESELLFGR